MKKWLNAIWVSRENIFKTWTGQVSYDVTDVSVPENTVFYFFSDEKIDMEMVQLSLTKQDQSLYIKFNGLILQNRIYCYGQKEGNNLVLIKSNYEKVILEKFFDICKGFNLEFI